jgi:hypothetical protein
MNSKSKRKFRLWDNKTLFQTLQSSLQLKDLIEEKCGTELTPEELPMSVVPTEMLYDIVICFEAMYEKLLNEELLVAGYPKSSKSYH